MKSKAIFLDRDGTINIDSGYVYSKEDFFFVEGAVDAMAAFKKAGYILVVVTNQSGVARGLYTEQDVNLLHMYMNKELQGRGAGIDAFYFCPHHPDGILGLYAKNCRCRKPEPGMLLQALSDLCIDPGMSYMIGDSMRDIVAGKRAGIRSILIQEDNYSGSMAGYVEKPDAVVHDLREAARYILGT
jgi:D-glycero-D-manno-heptose 1,7-bisphosphate phosphatase